MRQAGFLLLLGLMALIAQGAFATFIPPPVCPDLGLLVVVGIGLVWRGFAAGAALVTVLGYVADIYSGSLLGQHALLNIFAFSSATLASRQLNLKGASALMVFVAMLTLVYGLLSHGLSVAFVETTPLGLHGWLALCVHGIANAVVAPLMLGIVSRVSAWGGGDDGAGRSLQIDPLRGSG